MYPAFVRGALTAGPEGVRGRVPIIPARCWGAMTKAECPDPVSDRFAVTPYLPFPILGPEYAVHKLNLRCW